MGVHTELNVGYLNQKQRVNFLCLWHKIVPIANTPRVPTPRPKGGGRLLAIICAFVSAHSKQPPRGPSLKNKSDWNNYVESRGRYHFRCTSGHNTGTPVDPNSGMDQSQKLGGG